MPRDDDDHLSERDFQRLASYIEGYSGIKMPPSKLTMVEGRLRRRVRANGLPNLKQYCHFLFEQNGLQTEAVELINVVTTNKTDFFREPDHFTYLVDRAVPLLLSQGRGRTSLKLWSSACSIGAEPYTLAMVLANLATQMAGLSFSITATDLSTDVLATALEGIYPEAMVAPVPAEMRSRYIMRSKQQGRQQVRIVPELRQTIQFGRVNLMEAPYPVDNAMDVIFCRNILIYFDKPTQERVLRNLCQHLRPGGYLFLGHSETLAGFDLPLQVAAATIFRRQ